MTTPFHILSATSIFGSREKPNLTKWAAIGGMFPDLLMYIFLPLYLLLGYDLSIIWGEIYFSDLWQPYFNSSHSFVVYVMLFILGLCWYKFYLKESLNLKNFLDKPIFVFLAGAFLHILFDFFVHSSDAYAQFYPLSTWRFHSPISYWESDRYGHIVGILDTLAVSIFIYLTTKKLSSKTAKWTTIILGGFWVGLSILIRIMMF